MRRSPLKPGNGLKRTPFKRKRPAEAIRRSRERIRRSHARRLGTKKPEPGSWKALEDRLECLLAQRVKMRDGGVCRQAGCAEVACEAPLDAGHIFPKGRYPGGRFLEVNLWAQCRRHNTAHIGRPELMERRYVAEYGREAYDALHALVLAQPRRQSIEWLREQIEASERAIRLMELTEAA